MTAPSDKLTEDHYAVMAALDRGENPVITPMMRKKLRRLELIIPAEPPRDPRDTPGRQRAPAPRRHQLTERGRQVLAARGAAQAGAAA